MLIGSGRLEKLPVASRQGSGGKWWYWNVWGIQVNICLRSSLFWTPCSISFQNLSKTLANSCFFTRCKRWFVNSSILRFIFFKKWTSLWQQLVGEQLFYTEVYRVSWKFLYTFAEFVFHFDSSFFDYTGITINVFIFYVRWHWSSRYFTHSNYCGMGSSGKGPRTVSSARRLQMSQVVYINSWES